MKRAASLWNSQYFLRQKKSYRGKSHTELHSVFEKNIKDDVRKSTKSARNTKHRSKARLG